MTREEQIKEYISTFIEQYAESAGCNPKEVEHLGNFIRVGINWADKTMIDKVCKWLKDNIEEFVHGRDWELDKEDLTACLRIEIYEEV